MQFFGFRALGLIGVWLFGGCCNGWRTSEAFRGLQASGVPYFFCGFRELRLSLGRGDGTP